MIAKIETIAQLKREAICYSLSQASIFKGLPEQDLKRIASYCSTRILARNEYLFRQHDPVVGFFILRSGLINVHRINANQEEQIIHLLHPGESFAERAIASTTGYPAHAQAVEESEVILIPIEEFKQHQKENPDLTWRMITSMDKHLCTFVRTLEGLQIKDVETRLLHWLLENCPSQESSHAIEIQFNMTQKELAAKLTITRETLSRLFKKLREANMIEIKLHSVVILNPQLLSRYFHSKCSP